MNDAHDNAQADLAMLRTYNTSMAIDAFSAVERAKLAVTIAESKLNELLRSPVDMEAYARATEEIRTRQEARRASIGGEDIVRKIGANFGMAPAPYYKLCMGCSYYYGREIEHESGTTCPEPWAHTGPDASPPPAPAGPAAYCGACARSGVGACDAFPDCPAGRREQ